MLVELLIAVLLGCFLGIFTGLCPGIHINLVAAFMFSYSLFFLEFVSPLFLAVVIASMSIVHTFLDVIPSVFLGAPNADTALSVLPGHRLLIKGHGYEAVMLTIAGSFYALVIVSFLIPVIILLVSKGYPLVKPFIGFILIASSLFLIFREPKSKFWALFVFLISGCLGVFVLHILELKDPLFPMFSGLFGVSVLIVSIKENTVIPKQKGNKVSIQRKPFLQALFSSVFSSSLCSFFPALGPTQAAIIGSQFFKKLGDKGFLVLVGGIGTVNMVLSFVSLYVIGKARNGSIVVMSDFLKTFNLDFLLFFLGISLVSACFAVFLSLFFASRFSAWICKVNYRILCLTIAVFVTILVLLLSGVVGFLVFCVSVFLGLLCHYLDVGKSHLMGSLILPVLFYFFL